MVLPDLRHPDDLAACVAALDRHLRTPLMVQGREIFVQLSMGSAVTVRGSSSPVGETAERMTRDADAAMYRVKERRRHNARSLDRSDGDLLQLDADLHHAVARGEIVAHFQPQYDSRIGNLTGYEALARWNHPQLGTLAPSRFIDLADATGLIDAVGDEVLAQACRFVEAAAAGRPLQMQVNISAQQLASAGIAARIGRILDDHPERVWSLNMEVTESALVRDYPAVSAEIERIRDLGVGVAIDDFGSGYSSLAQLRDIPATELKIDRSFVHREGAVGTSMLTAIVALARGLDLTVVAEGIESQTQLETARRLGCDRLQGVYLSPPLDPDRALLARPDIADLLPSSR